MSGDITASFRTKQKHCRKSLYKGYSYKFYFTPIIMENIIIDRKLNTFLT